MAALDTTTRGTIDYGGLDVAVFDAPGAPSAEPLVLLHGLASSSSWTYESVVAGFAPFPRLLIDFPGFGESSFDPEWDATMESCADLVIAVTETWAGFSLLGHSMGGSIAIVVAAKRPDLVRRLIVAEPNLDPHTGAFSAKVTSVDEAEYVNHQHAALCERYARSRAKRFAASLSESHPAALHRAATSLRADRSPTFREILASVQMPRLYIGGDSSHPDDVADVLPEGVESQIITGATHAMMNDRPDEFVHVVSDFVQR